MVVGIAQVQLSENRVSLEGLKKSINQGQRVFILDGDVIKGPVVPKSSILLAHKTPPLPGTRTA